MAIREERVRVKRDAIASKDLVAIHAANVDMPIVGRNYTLAQLQGWMAELLDLFDLILRVQNTDVIRGMNFYENLPANKKIVADRVLDFAEVR